MRVANAVAEILKREGVSDMPIGAAGIPTLDRPVRKTLCPVMKDERPAVHDCSP